MACKTRLGKGAGKSGCATKKPERCAAKTKAGTRCKKMASGRSKFCASHK
jgi:hypothetical protein